MAIYLFEYLIIIKRETIVWCFDFDYEFLIPVLSSPSNWSLDHDDEQLGLNNSN